VPALTKRFVDSVKPTLKEQIFYDPALIGFGIRVRPNGKKVFLLRYRNAEGLHKKLILGDHGELTPATARALAQRKLAEIHDGADPVTAKKERREAPTVADLGQRYLCDSRPPNHQKRQPPSRTLRSPAVRPPSRRRPLASRRPLLPPVLSSPCRRLRPEKPPKTRRTRGSWATSSRGKSRTNNCCTRC